MSIYFINLILILAIGIAILGTKEKYYSRKCYIGIICVQITLIAGFRDFTVGNDTLNYVNSFIYSKSETFNYIIKNAKKDVGFEIYEWCLGKFINNPQLYILICALLFNIALAYFIYKNSCNPVLSYVIFSALLFSFTLSGIRQTLAIAILLCAYEYIKERKLIPFVLLVILASTFHASALIFIVFYFLANKKVTLNYLCTIGILFIIIFLFKYRIFNIIKLINNTYSVYEVYNTGSSPNTFTFMLILIFIGSFIFKDRILASNNNTINHYYNALSIALILCPLAYVNPSAMRINMYFTTFLIIFIPMIIKSFENLKSRLIIYFIVYGSLILLYIKININEYYKFFW